MFLDLVLVGRVTSIASPTLHIVVVQVYYVATPSVIANANPSLVEGGLGSNLRVSLETVHCSLALTSCQKHQSSTIRRMGPNSA